MREVATSLLILVHTAELLTIYDRIYSEKHNQSEDGICDRMLVDLH